MHHPQWVANALGNTHPEDEEVDEEVDKEVDEETSCHIW